MRFTIKIAIDGREATITMPDGTQWLKELADGQREEEFCEYIDATIRTTFGDKIKSLTTTKVG